VRSRIEREAAAGRPRTEWWAPARVPRLVFGAAAVAIVVLVVGLVPGTRHAVAGLFGVRGERIEHRRPPVTVTSAPNDKTTVLGLGAPVSLAEARRRIPQLLIPTTSRLPDRILARTDRPEVTLVYVDATGNISTLVTQFVADARPFFDKMLGNQTAVEPVTVNGGRGVWLAGGDHFVFATDARGNAIDEQGRLSGNALIWVQGKLTVRMEGSFAKDVALQLAASMR
jgi:hypothetical protein